MSSAPASESALSIGEIRTGLVAHSSQLSMAETVRLLDLVPGEQVRHAARPRAYAVSPQRLTGIDCFMPSHSGRRVRGVGTFATRATLTGGLIVQSCSHTTLVPSSRPYRQAWSHYLANPGVAEYLGRLRLEDAAAGFAQAEHGHLNIEMGRTAESTIFNLQRSRLLDGRQPLHAPLGRWRWALQPVREDGGPGLYRFTVLPEGTRLIRLSVVWPDVSDLLDLVEDLALHDWLLDVVNRQIERARPGSGDLDRTLQHIGPVIDHLLHHWMPKARVQPGLYGLWDAFDRFQGLTRQWDLATDRIRDHVALNSLRLVLRTESEWSGTGSR
ncbi:SCO2521 family protein [Actinomadura sp. NPDC000600]|uniref:SCO2521 family protein n=1 Tax=Actinomadura sp. NPDC000600 TaxID=3154262 RepID=UPI0033956AD8